MRVYGCKAGQRKVYEIENNLEALQDFVDGYVETLNLGNNLIMMFDEEARFKEKAITCVLIVFNHVIEIRGNYLIVRQSGSELTDLTDNDIIEIKKTNF